MREVGDIMPLAEVGVVGVLGATAAGGMESVGRESESFGSARRGREGAIIRGPGVERLVWGL